MKSVGARLQKSSNALAGIELTDADHCGALSMRQPKGEPRTRCFPSDDQAAYGQALVAIGPTADRLGRAATLSDEQRPSSPM